MLLSFSVSNFRSFRYTQTLSLIADRVKDNNECLRNVHHHVSVLPVSTIYGANSSGKSNLVKALWTMRGIILDSASMNPSDKLYTNSFALDASCFNHPTKFEATFSINTNIYRYGFEYNADEITREWLYLASKNSDKVLFSRHAQTIDIGKGFNEGGCDHSKVPSNRLFLSFLAQMNGPVSKSIIEWFNNNLLLVNRLQVSAENVEPIERPIWHYVRSTNGNLTRHIFPFSDMESSGTKDLNILRSLANAVLGNGGTLVVDELTNNLHPRILIKIVEEFNSAVSNPNNAQLILTTHCTEIMNNWLLRRDQIVFAEMDNETESTNLYSLADLKEQDGTRVRNDRIYCKDYINGKYGATPVITNDLFEVPNENNLR